MTNRNPVVVFILSLITCGIYHIVWFVSTKTEMNQRGASIPTAWLLIVPFVNLYWLWRYSEGVEKVSGFSGIAAFLLMLFLGAIGAAIVQAQFNKVTQPAAIEPPAQS
jgi:uncharacterized membrane protein YozB (DUF420 family)